jgi:hypothetical protein
LFLDVTEVNPIKAEALIKLQGMVYAPMQPQRSIGGAQHPNVAWRRERT